MSTDKKLNIYMIGPTWPYRGGIAHYTTLLFRAFKAQNHKVTLCAVKRQYPMWLYPGKTDKDPSKKPLEEPGIEYLLDSMNPFSWLRTIMHIRKSGPDVVIIPWWVTFWTVQYWIICKGIRWFSKAKILFVCHNVVEHESSKLKNFLTKIVMKQGDFFLVHSGDVEKTLLRLVPDAKIGVKGHPKYDFFQSGDMDRNTARAEYGFKPDDLVLLFFGFVRKYKGVPYLLDALRILKDEYPHVKLLLVGEAWHEEEETIQAKISEYGVTNRVVRVNDYVPNEDVGLYFSVADVAVFPYSSATASGALQISLAMQVPVIATNMSCFEEVVDDGQSGIIINPDSPQAIADAVKEFTGKHQVNRERIKQMKAHIAGGTRQIEWSEMADFLTGLVTGQSK